MSALLFLYNKILLGIFGVRVVKRNIEDLRC